MIKIFLSVRNRLGITIKCLEAIKQHTKSQYQIYVYDNQTNYKLEEHFKYFSKMFKKGLISQVTFTSNESTFNAFSKASTCNFWGKQHQQDPKKDSYSFLLMLDNDIIVTPGWDTQLIKAWNYVNSKNIQRIKCIGQLPGGIKNKKEEIKISNDLIGRIGTLGGSGLWSVRTNFFEDVGFLDLKQLVGHNKRHDQLYWQLMQKAAGNQPYIMGINKKLGIHCGSIAGSVCNTLTRNKNKMKDLSCINFEEADEQIKKIKFDDFYASICNNKILMNDW